MITIRRINLNKCGVNQKKSNDKFWLIHKLCNFLCPWIFMNEMKGMKSVTSGGSSSQEYISSGNVFPPSDYFCGRISLCSGIVHKVTILYIASPACIERWFFIIFLLEYRHSKGGKKLGLGGGYFFFIWRLKLWPLLGTESLYSLQTICTFYKPFMRLKIAITPEVSLQIRNHFRSILCEQGEVIH